VASREVENLGASLQRPELDSGHFIDSGHELKALLTGALHVPDATPAAGSFLRAALERIAPLMACHGKEA
jgi:hypothetical protein